MKKNLAIYLALFSLLFVGNSCMPGDDSDVSYSPYAMLESFKLGNVRSSYPAFTDDGRDTIVEKTVDFSTVKFSINQATGEVYNVDSLPYATDVSKLVVNIGVNGSASIYVDSIAAYDYFLTTDSLDFSRPRKIRVISYDTKFRRDYVISVNVHKVEPELMKWDKSASPEELAPLRVVEFGNRMCLFGDKNGKPAVAESALDGMPLWQSAQELVGLPAVVDLSTVQCFNGSLYVVADDGLYVSDDAVNWKLSYEASGLRSIVAASDYDSRMWVASDDALLASSDGAAFDRMGDLPAGFPVSGVSIVSSQLKHYKELIRYTVIGYPASGAKATVWSRLSNENEWVKFENEGNLNPCPSLKGLSVIGYDDFLYALGGAGDINGVKVQALSSFYISKDNGITWKSPTDFYQRLPKELVGHDVPFVVTVDSNNVIWIVTGGDDNAVWKGLINRLGFKK